MAKIDKQIPSDTIAILLEHKKEVLNNISTHYQINLTDANSDSDRLFKYGFVFVTLLETATGVLAVALVKQEDVLLFIVSILFLTLSIVSTLYERLRIEKAELRHYANREREPIMQQIALLKSFLEPEEQEHE